MKNSCEKKFKEWLEKNNVPYMYFDQTIDTYSTVFRNFAQRPDFMVLIPNFGFILVDVVESNPNAKYKKYCLNAGEVIKYSNLQRKFNLQVWYAISNSTLNYDTWYWISVSNLLELPFEKYTAEKTKDEYYAILPSKMIQIATNDSMGRLFEKIFQID